jgi:hypothetical protein
VCQAWEWVDFIFAPKVVMRQFLLALALEMGLFSYQVQLSTYVCTSARLWVMSSLRRRVYEGSKFPNLLTCMCMDEYLPNFAQLASRLTTRLINKLSVRGRQISETRRR